MSAPTQHFLNPVFEWGTEPRARVRPEFSEANGGKTLHMARATIEVAFFGSFFSPKDGAPEPKTAGMSSVLYIHAIPQFWGIFLFNFFFRTLLLSSF